MFDFPPFGGIDRNKNYSISVPNTREGVVANTRVAPVKTSKIMLITLTYGGSFVIDLGMLVLEVKVPLLLTNVTHNRALSILILQETLLGRSEYIWVMMHHWRLVEDSSWSAKSLLLPHSQQALRHFMRALIGWFDSAAGEEWTAIDYLCKLPRSVKSLFWSYFVVDKYLSYIYILQISNSCPLL